MRAGRTIGAGPSRLDLPARIAGPLDNGINTPPRGRVPTPQRPFLSVLVCAYGRRQFLRSAVDSVLAQTIDRSEYELLVARDFSDEALDQYLRANDAILVPGSEAPMGPKVARMARLARGEVLVLLDDDDLFEPDKLAVVRRAFERDPELGYLHRWFRPIDDAGRLLPPESFRWENSRSRERSQFVRIDGDSPIARLRAFPWLAPDFCDSLQAIRRDVLLRQEPALDSPDLFAVDSFLYFAALMAHRALFFDPRPLTRYRLHTSNSSAPTGDGPSEAHYRRLERSCEAIVRTARTSGDASVAREAEAVLAAHRVDRLLAQPSRRKEIWATLWAAAATRSAYVWHSRSSRTLGWGPLLELGAHLVEPKAVHRAATALRRWTGRPIDVWLSAQPRGRLAAPLVGSIPAEPG